MHQLRSSPIVSVLEVPHQGTSSIAACLLLLLPELNDRITDLIELGLAVALQRFLPTIVDWPGARKFR